jgi:hypothetical protein
VNKTERKIKFFISQVLSQNKLPEASRTITKENLVILFFFFFLVGENTKKKNINYCQNHAKVGEHQK